MDLASITGILSGLCLIIVAIFLKGDLTNFLNIPGLMIVLGGTMASTLLTFSLRDVAKAFQAALFVLYERNIDSNEMVKTMIKLSNISRRQGLVALGHIRTNHPILKKGCNLIADCAKEEIVNYPPHRAGSFICLSDEKREKLHLFVLERQKEQLREKRKDCPKNHSMIYRKLPILKEMR